jgi:hypothetical protein
MHNKNLHNLCSSPVLLAEFKVRSAVYGFSCSLDFVSNLLLANTIHLLQERVQISIGSSHFGVYEEYNHWGCNVV